MAVYPPGATFGPRDTAAEVEEDKEECIMEISQEPLEIKPLIGIGGAGFGMTPREVESALQEEQVYEDWMGGNLNDSLLYHGLILHFDRQDSRGPLEHAGLCEIEVYQREDAFLFGRFVNEWTRQEIIFHLDDQGVEYVECDNADVWPSQLFMNLSFDESERLVEISLWRP